MIGRIQVRIGILSIAAIVLATGQLFAQNPATDGMFVTVKNPITEGTLNQIKAGIDKARNTPGRNIKIVVFDFNPNGQDASTENYGACYDLADYIRTLANNNITPVAFVHAKATHHTVLPIIACSELVMSSSARIGEVASAEKPLNQDQIDRYTSLAGLPRAAAVLKMIDRNVVMVQGLHRGGQIYVDLRKVDSNDPLYTDVRVINRTPVNMPAGLAMYDVEQARRFGLCQLQKETRAEVAARYNLPASSIDEDPLGAMARKGVLFRLEGKIDGSLREKMRRQLETARANKENTFIFQLECSGGDPTTAREIADMILAFGKDGDYMAETIAYIPNEAADLSTMIAFACHKIIMYRGGPNKQAQLGNFEDYLRAADQQRFSPEIISQNLREIAEKRGYPSIICDALFNPEIELIQARNITNGETQVMDRKKLGTAEGKNWEAMGAPIKQRGEWLVLNATTMENLRLAKTIPNQDIQEVYTLLNLEQRDVRNSKPSWLDSFAAFLRRTDVSILLVIIGIAGLVLELKAPGLMLPGIVAALCFVLFFWSQTQLGGALIYLAIMLFILGILLLGIELFLIPGFGVAGVSGIILMLCGIVLAGVDRAPESRSDWIELISRMLRYGLTMVGAGIGAFFLGRLLPSVPYANRLMLSSPADAADNDVPYLPGNEQALSLLGQTGAAVSMLRPAGTAKFGDAFVDVVTEGDFIDPGTPIQVVEVEGNRIVVKRV
ncbi:MAG: NfeD family protein [Zavarzinella sp.]